MIVVGLLGRIGAGKSTVARRFATHGAHVIDADRIAHAALDQADVARQIATRFGREVLDADGRIRRRVLAGLVFGPTPEHGRALAWLESVVHPLVRSRITAELAAVEARQRDRPDREVIVVLDVPLLVQAGWADVCDRLVEVSCSEEVRRARLAARHWPVAEQEAREAAWDRKYSAAAVPQEKIVLVDTSGDLTYTLARIDSIWSGLSG